MVVDMTLAAGPKSQGSTDTDGGSSASCPHPRIAERRQHVALVKAEEKLLLELDRLIDSLDHLSRLTSQFLNLRFIAQELRKETAILDMRSPEGLAFVEQIGRQMAEIKLPCCHLMQ
jgi:hypothetical protein